MYVGIIVYMYVCIIVYMYVCIIVYMYVCIIVYMYVCIIVYMYVCIIVSCHVVFDNPDWLIQRVQVVCTLVFAPTAVKATRIYHIAMITAQHSWFQ